MNNIIRDIKCEDGTVDTVIISSEDNYSVSLTGRYKIANCYTSNNGFSQMFKNSIFGADIGVGSRGFAGVALISFVVAILSFVVLYFSWRI